MRGKHNKWRAQQRSQVAERTGDSVGADVTSVLRDQTLTGLLLLHFLHHGIHIMPLVLLRLLYLSVFIWQQFFFFFLNHAAVDVLAFLSFFFVEFLSMLLFSFGFGHFWHIWWACSRPDSVGFATPYSVKYYIGYQVYLLTWFISEDSISYPCIYIMQ